MTPKGIQHEVVETAPAERWYRLPHYDCGLAVATTFRFSEDSYLESDTVIFARASGIPGLAADNVLLIVEIADSSLQYDMGRKTAPYARFGVRELWVVDAIWLTARVHRDPTRDGYRETLDFGRADRLAPLLAPEAFALRLDELELA